VRLPFRHTGKAELAPLKDSGTRRVARNYTIALVDCKLAWPQSLIFGWPRLQRLTAAIPSLV
jgi:hypothetical protein